MANHLIIGLGGTGGNVIRSLRKKIYQNLQKDDPENVNIRYLYVDTSEELMAFNDPSWKILGHSVQLPEKSQLLISGVNLRYIIDEPVAYPGISSWLGDRNDYKEILNSAEGARRGASQRRRLGRLLFACKVGEFNKRVNALVSEMTTSTSGARKEADVSFHICCGLAGGTGSGSIVDALLQLRSKFQKSPIATYKIIVYAALPARYPPPRVVDFKTEYYHANGYAALLELNALSIGKWAPHDISGAQPSRLRLEDPFHNCYLFSDESSSGVRIDLTQDGPDIIASFLYQKLVEFDGGDVDFRQDNPIAKAEDFEQPISAERDSLGELARSLAFFSLGIKQIAYPEVEIKEFLTYSFALQATRQLLYNNWGEGIVYREETLLQPFNEWIRSKTVQERWFLTDERLMLSEGLLVAEVNNKEWRTIQDFWRNTVVGITTRLTESNKMAELARRCDAIYRDEYRGTGVKAFYEAKRGGDMREQILELRSKIERDLFADWHNGERSLRDITRLLDALLDMIEERKRMLDVKIVSENEESVRYRENMTMIDSHFKQWHKLNIFSIGFGKDKALLSAQAECFITRYTLQTRVEGMRYARELLIGLRQELNGLAVEVGTCVKTVSEVSTKLREELSVRCADNGEATMTGQVIKFYEPKRVRAFSRLLVIDQKVQRKQAALVRDRIVEQLADRKTFMSFHSQLCQGEGRGLMEILESSCNAMALEAHQAQVDRFPRDGGILEVGLIKLMENRFGTNEEALSKYIQRVLSMAGEYLVFEDTSEIRGDTGVQWQDRPSTRRQALLAILPEATESINFRDSLEKAIGSRAKLPVTYGLNKARKNEVTLISHSSAFPVRFSSLVALLQSEYYKLVSESGPKSDSSFIVLHLEGTRSRFLTDQWLPDLYPARYTTKQFRPMVMIAEAMGMLQVDRDRENGVQKLYLRVTANGTPKPPLPVAISIEDLINSVDAKSFEAIKKEVETRLVTSYKHVDQRKSLLSQIEVEVGRIGEVFGDTSTAYLQACEAYEAVKEKLTYKEQYAN